MDTMLKFRSIGGFLEGEPVDPSKKSNMKKREKPVKQEEELVNDYDLEEELERLKQQIFSSKDDESLPQPLDMGVNVMLEKLEKEVDEEFTEAVRSMGLKDKVEALRMEVSRVSVPDQPIDHLGGVCGDVLQEVLSSGGA
ncbi:hypothetical protein QJS04_geneDACA024196 [Acorus gramineus]|uniref:Uncharacterized protein n=1 Tax=Acorus gramineus TaxID=55184 RepID=A0AAV9BN90_ACOGR|nr:hypothetical protein QJS04_geneDACA024196 [Acorus gramineus]